MKVRNNGSYRRRVRGHEGLAASSTVELTKAMANRYQSDLADLFASGELEIIGEEKPAENVDIEKPVRELVPMIEAGELDGRLDELSEDDRVTIKRAVEARYNELG